MEKNYMIWTELKSNSSSNKEAVNAPHCALPAMPTWPILRKFPIPKSVILFLPIITPCFYACYFLSLMMYLTYMNYVIKK